MDTRIPDSHILTPQMLRDRARIHREKATAMERDALYTDSSQARLLIEERAWEHRSRANALDDEADILAADLAAQPKEPVHG